MPSLTVSAILRLGLKHFNYSDAGSALTDCPLSMSYCEGADAAGSASLPPRFTRGGRPVSAPLTQSMFDDSRYFLSDVQNTYQMAPTFNSNSVD